MPQFDVTIIGAAASQAQKAVLFEKITDLMVNVLGRTRKAVVVSVTSVPASDWASGGTSQPDGKLVGIQAVVKILAGTNTDAQKAQMIAEASALLREVLGEPAMPLYVTFTEIPAESWGYDGRTVADMRRPRAAS